MAIQAGLLILTARNEINVQERDAKDKQVQKQQTNGYWNFVKNVWNSPAVARTISTTIFFANTLAAFYEKKFVLATIFACNGIGAAAVAYHVNRDTQYWHKLEIPRAVEKSLKALRKLPSSLKLILKDPGASWTVGDFLTAAIKVSWKSISTSPITIASLAVGFGIAVLANLQSVARIFGKKIKFHTKTFGCSCMIAQCFGFAMFNFTFGNKLIGVAFLFWAASTYMIRRIIKRQGEG